ncbi:thioesterase II family protein [Kitasatospora viridis]|uniref:Surfactin synthase thioesterase subunit n=1 Tax=Kitasatospora viridis TaxID=281105 RepID=A0A561T6F0_9ACTN|nr:alpha/beta fold hydrolase [Kitasatospora viridis]TWF82698.1 surfactin synthase thioesterase subunit [Kitasatospora viridis]
MTARRSRWLLCRDRDPGARLRLYFFPHSGGSAGEYLRWGAGLPGVEVWGVQPPGRAGRMAEPPIDRLDQLVQRLLAEAEFDGPFAFFGHSLGALVAFETARALRAAGREQPVALIASGLGAPRHQPGRPPLGEVDDARLIAALAAQGESLPPDLLADDELRAQLLGCLRADIRLLDGYRHRPGEPLDLPITVLAGREDTEPERQLRDWADHTTAPTQLELLPGGHFYLREQHDAAHRTIAGALHRAVPEPAG